MNKVISYLEDLEAELVQLSGLCNALGCIGDSGSEPPIYDIAFSYRVIRDMLDGKAAEIDKVVSEYYETGGGDRSLNRESKEEETC